MENHKNLILTMQYEDGTGGKRELLSMFKADNRQDYAALLPLNEDESVQEGASIELVRVKPCRSEDMEEDYLVEGIDTEEEFQVAKEAFDRVVAETLNQLEITDNESDGTSVGDLPTISIQDGDGEMRDWKVVDVFDYNNRKYIALIPLIETGDGINVSIYLMRLSIADQDGVEGYEINPIPSDMEYDEIAKVFEGRIGVADECHAMQDPGVVSLS